MNSGSTQAAGAYAWYTLGLLILAYALAFLDRHILSLLVEPIKQDLELSDTQFSLLHGLAFAALLAICGLPAGRQADRGRRIALVAAGMAIWSLMTAACGLARSFGTLMVCRMGIGAGEASLTPAAYSLIGDLFPPRRLGLALGLYTAGVYIGGGLALGIGAFAIGRLQGVSVELPVIGALQSWQLIFIAVGLPGLPLALWVASLREPPRRHDARHAPTLRETARYLRQHARALLCLGLCMSCAAMTNYASNAWIPSFLIRQHGLNAGEAGVAYGAVVSICGLSGVVIGGLLGDALVARGHRAGRLRLMCWSALAAAPCIAAMPHMPTATIALAPLALATLFITVIIGSGPAALQEIVPGRMRGTASALGVMMVNLLGLGLGPTLVALLSDYGFGDPARIGEALGIAAAMMSLFSAALGALGLGAYARARSVQPA